MSPQQWYYSQKNVEKKTPIAFIISFIIRLLCCKKKSQLVVGRLSKTMGKILIFKLNIGVIVCKYLTLCCTLSHNMNTKLME